MKHPAFLAERDPTSCKDDWELVFILLSIALREAIVLSRRSCRGSSAINRQILTPKRRFADIVSKLVYADVVD
jgi:hypothetical protein